MGGEEVDPRLRDEDDVECGELFATIKKNGAEKAPLDDALVIAQS